MFLGIERPDWALLQLLRPARIPGSAYAVTADTASIAGGRLSFALGLRGAPCTCCKRAKSHCVCILRAQDGSLLPPAWGEGKPRWTCSRICWYLIAFHC